MRDFLDGIIITILGLFSICLFLGFILILAVTFKYNIALGIFILLFFGGIYNYIDKNM